MSGAMFNYHGYRVWRRLQASWVQDGGADLQYLGWFPIAKNYVIQNTKSTQTDNSGYTALQISYQNPKVAP